jgi:hypothetical protein
MAFDHEQRAIAKSASVAFALTIILLVVTGLCALFEADHLQQRLRLLALALTAPAFALFVDIARLANHRFAEPLDRNAAAAETKTAKADMLSAILRNTHEQATLAAFVYGIARSCCRCAGPILYPPALRCFLSGDWFLRRAIQKALAAEHSALA